MSNEQHQANGTKSIDKALKVLKCFIGSSEYLTMTGIANQLELPYSTTSRILSILEEEGFLQRDSLTKRYKLGKCAYLLGYYARLEDTLQKIVNPYLVKLKKEFEETSTMYIREGHIRRLYAKAEPEKYFRFAPSVGAEYYLWAGAGAKSFLAFMSEPEREKIISEAERLTPKTILDRNALSEEIVLVRKRGYALSLDEYSEGFSSIAGPVVNDKDEALCTIAVTGPSTRFSEDRRSEIGERIKEYCVELSRLFGWPGPFDGEEWVFPFLFSKKPQKS